MVPNRSRSDAEHLMTIARQPDPEVAYQKKLEKQKEYTARYLQKKVEAQVVPSPPQKIADDQPPETTPEPELILASPPKAKRRFPDADGDDELIEDLVNVFRQLSWDGRARGMRRLKKLYNDWRVGKP